MLLGQNLSRPSNFSPSPSLHEAHSRPTSCLGLLQPINIGPAIGLVAIATGSTPPCTRPLHHRVPGRRANPMSRPGGRIDPVAQGPPLEPDTSSTWSREWRTERKFLQSETEPNPRRINL
jgi:hypothetical protein